MSGQRIGVVINGVIYVDDHPVPTADPTARALALITDLHHTVRYLTAPRWKRPLLRLLRWFR
ncbi:Uncharacterised protein [Mycobacteroides abscessus subsp. abscessus]|uniref:hypothetical protein n=1 Tax=Mycobacteroides abscessus TaxID=36809 RepID=UPI0009A882BC|nr:hypothetical protein [Mycobacteroides abscessus]SLJ40182.1 Uncharacterised protein [Mycobacteroides abscessus subsp. abscessus]